MDNIDNLDINDLAAQYVLGTLESPRREQFSVILASNATAKEAVTYWENVLSPLAESLPAQQPPSNLWIMIRRRLGHVPATNVNRNRSLWLWQAWAAVATFLFVLTIGLVWVVQPESESIQYEYATVVEDGDGVPLWSVQLDADTYQVAVQTIQLSEQAQAEDSPTTDFELWLIEPGKSPVSLGVLPKQGQAKLQIAGYAELDQAQAIAVSLEAAGGSKTGLPSDKVLYVTPL